MVNVTHYADYRRSGYHILFLVFDIILNKLGDYIYLLFHLAKNIVINCDILGFFIGKLGIESYHLALHKELLDDVGRLLLHLVRKILDGDNLRDCDGLDLFLNRLNNFRLDKCTLSGLLLACCHLIVSLVRLLCSVLVLLTIGTISLGCLSSLIIKILISEVLV